MTTTDMDGGNEGAVGLAVHLAVLTFKAINQLYYGQVVYSYFNGCFDGGREAVMEAIRYPDDFNGIITGTPAMLF